MRRVITVIVVVLLLAAALYLLRDVYWAYETRPWTRDGQVQAELVPITALLDAPVRRVLVRDNQAVRAGDLLVELGDDEVRAEAQAAQLALELATAEAAEESLRGERGIAGQKMPSGAEPSSRTMLPVAMLRQKQAQLALERARIRCALTEIRAPVDGYVTQVRARPGIQVRAGQTLFHVIDSATFRVTAFFRETVLPGIQPGAMARVTLMAYPEMPLQGHVESVGWGISRKDGEPGADGLPVVSPTFDWIRLAQRIPVNIRLDSLSEKLLLRVGMTASVQIFSDTEQDGQDDTAAHP